MIFNRIVAGLMAPAAQKAISSPIRHSPIHPSSFIVHRS